jgi:nitric oxide dioxygenase
MSLTPKQIQIVRSTVPVLKVHGNEITTRFYKTLLDDIPELHNTFNTTNQTSGSQQRALTGFLCAYASHIDDLGSLSPAVESICQKHASLYVKPGHYKIVGKYLLRAMGDVLHGKQRTGN